MSVAVWIGLASVLFSMIALGCSFYISRLLPVAINDSAYLFADAVLHTSTIGRDGCAFLALIAVLFQLWGWL